MKILYKFSKIPYNGYKGSFEFDTLPMREVYFILYQDQIMALIFNNYNDVTKTQFTSPEDVKGFREELKKDGYVSSEVNETDKKSVSFLLQ